MALPFYTIGPVHHGIAPVSDEHGIVATFEIEAVTGSKPVWRIEADPTRFPPGSALPAVFLGNPIHRVDHIADVRRMFGIAVSGPCLVSESKAARRAA